VRRYSGYSFSLHDTIASTLPSEVISLAQKMTAQRWSTMTAISAWYTGVSNVFLSFVALSFALWRGRAWWNETIIMSLVRPSSPSPPLPSPLLHPSHPSEELRLDAIYNHPKFLTITNTDRLDLLLHQLRHYDAPNPLHSTPLWQRCRAESLPGVILGIDVGLFCFSVVGVLY
jgi:hypothetical protein